MKLAVERPARDDLLVHEIYASVQGESSFVGLPCTFVRLTGCNLRCRWCDTPDAFGGGERMPLDAVRDAALALGTPLIEVTGGEPLLQQAVLPLMTALCDADARCCWRRVGSATSAAWIRACIASST